MSSVLGVRFTVVRDLSLRVSAVSRDIYRGSKSIHV